MTLPMLGGFFALMLILYSVYRAFKGHKGVTFIHNVLAFLIIAVLSIAVINSQAESPQADLIIMAAAVAAVVFVAGGIIFFIEKRKTNLGWNDSQGILVIGVSGLLLMSVLIGPVIKNVLTRSTFDTIAGAQDMPAADITLPTAVSASPTPVVRVQNVAPTTTDTDVPAPTTVPTQVNTPVSTVTNLNTLPTRYVFTTPVPTATLSQEDLCQGVVQNNLNFRDEPSAEAELLTTIPHSEDVFIYGQNADGTWLYVSYNNQPGWVSADYIILNADCGEIPVQETS